MLADAAAARLDPSTGRKTLLLIQQDAWGDAAGVILQLYKRQLPIVVDPDWISMFGQPLAPGGGPADAFMDKMVFLPRNADLAPGDTLVGCTPGTCLVLR
jgi:hypothetical protein